MLGTINHCTSTGIKPKSTAQDLLTDISEYKLNINTHRVYDLVWEQTALRGLELEFLDPWISYETHVRFYLRAQWTSNPPPLPFHHHHNPTKNIYLLLPDRDVGNLADNNLRALSWMKIYEFSRMFIEYHLVWASWYCISQKCLVNNLSILCASSYCISKLLPCFT